jgi:hypothetical protein
MFQQLPGHGLEHMKESHGDIRCSSQERSYILDHAMGVIGLVDGHKNVHRDLLERCPEGNALPPYYIPVNSRMLAVGRERITI